MYQLKNSILIFVILTTINQNAWAYEEKINDQTCEVILKNNNSEKDNYYIKKLIEHLNKKNYTIKKDQQSSQIDQGLLTVSFKRSLENSGFYPPCNIEIILFKNNKDDINSDKEIYKKSIRRSVPRVSRDGVSRCSIAIRDAMVEFPTCYKVNK